MEQIQRLEALAAEARQLDEKDLANFLANLRTIEKNLQDLLRERQDWREFRRQWPDLA
jgi:predicted component of type VI protein secretion system